MINDQLIITNEMVCVYINAVKIRKTVVVAVEVAAAVVVAVVVEVVDAVEDVVVVAPVVEELNVPQYLWLNSSTFL